MISTHGNQPQTSLIQLDREIVLRKCDLSALEYHIPFSRCNESFFWKIGDYIIESTRLLPTEKFFASIWRAFHRQYRMGNTSSSRRSTRGATSRQSKLPQNLEGLVDIKKLVAKIDEKETTIDERSSAVMKYRTPHFRASAVITIPPMPENETWQVGWIQACTDMSFVNTYGMHGVSSWEFPQLKSGNYTMISDSDGRNYPWYGSRTEVATLTGPTDEEQTVQVSMNDNFYPHITWSIPIRNQRDVALTHVKRTQGFYSWLVAKNVQTGQHYILKTIRWSMHLVILVDPSKPLGQRATLVGTGIQNQPQILKYNVEIPKCALDPPNANSAQTLIWYPTTGNPQVIVPPKWHVREE